MTNTQRHAQREFDVINKLYSEPDNKHIIKEFEPEIMALCEKFGLSGQSGGSAPMVASCLSGAIEKLLLQEPIAAITGEEHEWVDVSAYCDGYALYQNNRCGGLFREGKDGRSFFVDAIIFKGDKCHNFNGSALLGEKRIYSKQCVKSFPFIPKRFYIDVIDIEEPKDWWEHTVKTPSQLKKVWHHYDNYE